MHDVLLVIFGSILGVNIRYIIYKNLEKVNLSEDYIILVINTISSFFLGFCLSFLTQISSLKFSYQLGLFLSIGFFGSLSTFSSFIYDLFGLFAKYKFYSAFKLLIVSLTFGIVSMMFGFSLGGS